MRKIVRNALPFPGIPWYGVTIFAVDARRDRVDEDLGEVPDLGPLDDLARPVRRAAVGVDEDRLRVGEVTGEARDDGPHDVPDRPLVVERRDPDEDVDLSDPCRSRRRPRGRGEGDGRSPGFLPKQGAHGRGPAAARRERGDAARRDGRGESGIDGLPTGPGRGPRRRSARGTPASFGRVAEACEGARRRARPEEEVERVLLAVVPREVPEEASASQPHAREPGGRARRAVCRRPPARGTGGRSGERASRRSGSGGGP